MLKGFEEDLSSLDLPDEVKSQLIEAANKRASGLVSKNEELLNKLSTTKSQAKESQSAAEKLAAMEALQEQRDLESKQNYDQALELIKSKSQKEVQELSEKVAQYEQKERNMLISKGINDVLAENRVNPLHQEYVSSYFKQNAQLVDGKVMIGDVSLSDFASEWAESDQGKAVRLAPESSGGNASGGTQAQGSGKNMTDAEKRAADINKRFNKV
jgi:hypothetical protein